MCTIKHVINNLGSYNAIFQTEGEKMIKLTCLYILTLENLFLYIIYISFKNKYKQLNLLQVYL